MKVCLDTNVLISAFTARGLSADVMRVVLTQHELVLPAVVLDEFQRVLRTKFKLPAADLPGVLAFFSDIPVIPKPAVLLPHPVIRDAADAWVLASAVAGGAGVLVTGDQDLLSVAAEAPVPIVTPRAFYERRGV